MKERNNHIDGIKFLLIILVVIGHCIVPSRYTNELSGGLFSLIYSFHMPLFIFISGYFCKVSTWEQWRRKSLFLVEPFLVIMLPQCLFFGTMRHLIIPGNSGWYLLSMIWWYAIIVCLRKFKLDVKWGGVIISIIVSFIVFLLPIGDNGHLFAFNRTVQFLPFFFTGYFLRHRELALPFAISKKWEFIVLVLSSVSLILIVSLSFVSTSLTGVLHNLEFYYIDAWSISGNHGFIGVVLLLVLRLAIMLVAVVFSVFIITRCKFPHGFSQFGSSTLLIYVIQGIVAHIGSHILPNFFVIQLLFASLIVGVSMILIKRIDCRYITNPVSTIFKQLKERNIDDSGRGLEKELR